MRWVPGAPVVTQTREPPGSGTPGGMISGSAGRLVCSSIAQMWGPRAAPAMAGCLPPRLVDAPRAAAGEEDVEEDEAEKDRAFAAIALIVVVGFAVIALIAAGLLAAAFIVAGLLRKPNQKLR